MTYRRAAVATPTAVRVDLPQLTDWQEEIFFCLTRFIVLAKGRRAGGTFLVEVIALAAALVGKKVWSISPTYPNASERWTEFKAFAVQIAGCDIREEPREIRFPGGGSITVKAATVGDSLRGAGVDLMVLHEFAFWEQAGVDAKYVWTQVLLPMLAIGDTRAVFESSPNGMNYFSELYARGEDSLQTDWQSFRLPTSANPLITPERIAAMRSEMTEEEARQELDAEFMDVGGLVFRRVEQNAIATKQTHGVAGHSYIIGVDLAKSRDYSAFAVVDLSLTPPSLVHLDRQGHVDYTLQVKRLAALCDRFHPQSVMVEANNAGTAVIEFMQAARIPNLRLVTTDNSTKAAWVENLAIAFENDHINIIGDKVLLAELGKFAAKKLPSGLIRYAAIGSNHDDTVMALLIAFSGVTHGRTKVMALAGPPSERARKLDRAKKVIDWLDTSEPIETVTVDAEFIR